VIQDNGTKVIKSLSFQSLWPVCPITPTLISIKQSLNSLVSLSVHHIIMFYSWIRSDRWLFLFTRKFRHFPRNFLSINFKSSLFLIPNFLQILSISLYFPSFLSLFTHYYSHFIFVSFSGYYFSLFVSLGHYISCTENSCFWSFDWTINSFHVVLSLQLLTHELNNSFWTYIW
jgi:hypothetical protein